MAITIKRVDNFMGSASKNKIVAIFQCTFTGNYSTGGDTLDFTQPSANLVGTSNAPLSLRGDNTFNGYLLQFIVGSQLNNNLVQVYDQAAAAGALPQLAAGAYPAALLNATFNLTAEFTKY